ncbi:MAG: hypothetical protein EA377_00945 [Phycisphaerales bacterium]|nr:MAG: hypothetical protein EA377_00945 [Phycisphaerales bacterium]
MLLLFAISAGGATQVKAVEPPTWPPELPRDTPRPIGVPKAASVCEALRTRPVVRAVVEEQETHVGGRTITQQRIEYVYSGPPGLVGQTFNDISIGPDFRGAKRGARYLILAPLKPGETGIWMLVPWEDTWFREDGRSLKAWWPARPNIDPPHGPDYENIVELAEAMETVCNAETEDERIDLLKGFAMSATSEVSVGAITLLEEIVPEVLLRFVDQTNVRELPIRAQILIDNRMMKLQRADWRDSESRQRLIAAWAADVIHHDDSDATLILIRLSQAIQTDQIEPQMMYAILRPIIAGDLPQALKGEVHSLEVRTLAVSTLRWIINDPHLREDVFNLTISVLEGDDDAGLKLAAAGVLRVLEQADADECATLTTLRDDAARLLAESEWPSNGPVRSITSWLEETVARLFPNDD